MQIVDVVAQRSKVRSVGQKVIIAGGVKRDVVSSTEVLGLVTRQISASQSEMASPRGFFRMVTIIHSRRRKMSPFTQSSSKFFRNYIISMISHNF